MAESTGTPDDEALDADDGVADGDVVDVVAVVSAATEVPAVVAAMT